MFLLVPAYPSSPGQKAVKRLLLLLYTLSYFGHLFIVMHFAARSWSKTKRKTKEDLERGCTEDCQARKMNKVDAIDRCKWRKMIKDVQ